MKLALAFFGEFLMNHPFYLALFAGVVLLFGCGPRRYPQIERQDDATAIVWTGVYAEHEYLSPDVEWLFPERLDCDANRGWFYRSNVCVWGLMHDWEYWAQVAHPVDFTFAGSSFAHELFHALLFVRTGDSDSGHANVGFGMQYGHPYGGLVDQANAALFERDL